MQSVIQSDKDQCLPLLVISNTIDLECKITLVVCSIEGQTESMV